MSGSIGAAVSHLVIYPLDLITTRLQTQRQFSKSGKDVSSKGDDYGEYRDVFDAIKKIYSQEGGIQAFYRGAANCTGKAVADSFLFFLAYNFLRETRRPAPGSNGKAGPSPLPISEELSIGVLSGAFARFWTTPLQNIVTRQQTASMIHARHPESSLGPGLSARDIALQIKDEKGWAGFWSGYSATLILTVNPSITFLLHELFLRLLVPQDRRKNPGPRLTFLIAAASKAIASTLTYPFSLAKSRAQVSSQSPAPNTSETKYIEDDNASSASRSAEAVAARRTVFGTILKIAQKEGIRGLYQGLGSEVLKGFFSHGLTMLTKERIHTLVIQLYYLVLKALNRYPSPQELAKAAGHKLGNAASSAKEKLNRDTVPAGDIYGKAHTTEQRNAFDSVTKPLENPKDAAAATVEKTRDALNSDTVPAGDLYGKRSEVGSSSHSDPETRQLGRSANVQQQITQKVSQALDSENTTVPPGDVYGKSETSVPQTDPETSQLKKSAVAAKEAVEKASDLARREGDTVTPGDIYGSEKKKE